MRRKWRSKQTKKKRQRRQFTPEFKAEVVALVETSDKTIAQLCRDLDLTESMVRNWVAAAHTQASPTATAQVGLEAENQELRKRIRELEMERAILKKAAVFFAKESS
jgi:transposase-like protein